MRRTLFPVTLGILLAVTVLAQQPATVKLQGRISDAETGRPIANAMISPSPAPSGLEESWIRVDRTLEKRAAAISDADGRFVISGLKPSSYSILVTARGYVQNESTLVIASSETNSLNVALIPTAAVSGRIESQDRRPLAGIRVQLLKLNYGVKGQHSLQEVDMTFTDDLGAYRFYWIAPGSYYIAAGFGNQSKPLNSPNEVPGEGVQPVYFPSASEVSQAAAIDLKPGDERTGVDFLFKRLHTHRVRGRVIDEATGKPPTAVTIYVETSVPGGNGGRLRIGL